MAPNPTTGEADVAVMASVVAAAEANARSLNGGPFAASVVRAGEVIATGENSVTTSNDPTAHAEVIAIRRACAQLGHFELTDCEIYASCEPCPMCLGAIYWARPRVVYFAATTADASRAGFDDSHIYDELSVAAARRTIPMIQLDVPGAGAPFTTWLGLARRQAY